MPSDTIQAAPGRSASKKKKVLSFFDVLRFAAGYWRGQRGKLSVILTLFVLAALIETYLPTALSNFLGAIRLGAGKPAILTALSVFLGCYFLLQNLYPIDKGHIRIDGQDTAHGSRKSLRSAIALVPQDPILFHRTLAENIAYGKPDADMTAIHGAAEQAHIAPFIMSLPQKYETLVGERGIKLSGGERQRIAIARAMLADRPILILDEATSSLDSQSERAIQEALRALTHGRTSIMVAHRLSTILDADRILVFDNGRIVEEGTHVELVVKEEGIYAGFFKLQSGGFIVEEVLDAESVGR
jgi:ABC-type transport system involved in cytochrome bd biosynthesis fused ATPase/permease subunit